MKMWLQFRFIQVLTWILILFKYPQRPLQAEYAARLVDDLYKKHAQYFSMMSKEEYEEVEEFLLDLSAIIVASDNFYQSTVNARMFINIKGPRMKEIMFSVKQKAA